MSKHFVFTHNNYTGETLQYLRDTFSNNNDIHYIVYGQEVAPTTGTRHLQGYVCFASRKRITAVRNLLPGAHVEIARGTPQQASDYAKKDGDFTEFGDFESIPFQGKRSDFDKFKEWLLEQATWPSDAHIAANWTALYCRYGQRLINLRELLYPRPIIETGSFNPGWQVELANELEKPCESDREIFFVVNEEGRAGKSWFCRKYFSLHDDVQLLGIGKRDDLAHAVDVTKRVFLLNVPRGSMQYLQYGFLESLKDRIVFSPKYNSGIKCLMHKPHVVIFSNEEPDYEAMTDDRYRIIHAEGM